jgi:tRNA (adenine22-N1)-methyltransferase
MKMVGDKMDLSRRLILIASMADKCNCIVDVGTDHGYVPIYLVKNGICAKAVASDINRGPVEKAQSNVASEGLSDKIECRQGGGLSTVGPAEVQGAIIAGMGGNLIRDIIEEGKSVFAKLSFSVLQPVQNAEILRKYVYESGFDILDEELCCDEGKFYEIIKVRYNTAPVQLEEIHYEISPVLLRKRHPLMKEFISYKLNGYDKIYEAIQEDTELARAKKISVQIKLEKVKELLSCL